MSRSPDDAPLYTDLRGVRYGEVLAVFARGEGLEAEVYGTQMLNDCPPELWGLLDPAAIAAELGALMVKLNGPRYWTLDGIGRKVEVVEPILRDFSGLTTRRIAVVRLGADAAPMPYRERIVERGAIFFFDAGKPVYELVDARGVAYVMQAYCVGVDPTLTEAALPGLGDRLALPAGWSYRTRVLEEELVVDTRAVPATVLQDELENSYTLPV
ncbi:MAG: hypothetical protein ACYDA2_06795 [Acidimicrobiales bacterium]